MWEGHKSWLAQPESSKTFREKKKNQKDCVVDFKKQFKMENIIIFSYMTLLTKLISGWEKYKSSELWKYSGIYPSRMAYLDLSTWKMLLKIIFKNMSIVKSWLFILTVFTAYLNLGKTGLQPSPFFSVTDRSCLSINTKSLFLVCGRNSQSIVFLSPTIS